MPTYSPTNLLEVKLYQALIVDKCSILSLKVCFFIQHDGMTIILYLNLKVNAKMQLNH